jgi:hypothetical protein
MYLVGIILFVDGSTSISCHLLIPCPATDSFPVIHFLYYPLPNTISFFLFSFYFSPEIGELGFPASLQILY